MKSVQPNGPDHDGDQEAASSSGARPTPPAQIAAVLANAGLAHEITLALRSLDLTFQVTAKPDMLISWIESDCPQIIILDLDLSPLPADLARFARSLRADVRIVSAEWYWSDRPRPAFADVIVHKPVRCGEWLRAMTRIGVPSGRRADTDGR